MKAWMKSNRVDLNTLLTFMRFAGLALALIAFIPSVANLGMVHHGFTVFASIVVFGIILAVGSHAYMKWVNRSIFLWTESQKRALKLVWVTIMSKTNQ